MKRNSFDFPERILQIRQIVQTFPQFRVSTVQITQQSVVNQTNDNVNRIFISVVKCTLNSLQTSSRHFYSIWAQIRYIRLVLPSKIFF